MSVNPTSIQSGFARSRSEALFPRLFPDAGWWCPSLNPPGGTRLHDLSGRQNWGTLTSMANDDWVVSGGRGALDFDGSNDYVTSIGTVSSFNFIHQTTICSYSFWMKTNTLTPATMSIMGSTRRGFEVGACVQFGGTSTLLNSIRTIVTANGLTIRDIRSTTNVITDTNWHHVTICLNGNAATSLMFVDGVSVVVASAAGGTAVGTGDATRNWSIGNATRTDNAEWFNGQLDDIRIYNRALSASEVRQLYQLGRGNMPRIRQRRYTEEVAGFKAYWANRRSRIIGAGI